MGAENTCVASRVLTQSSVIFNALFIKILFKKTNNSVFVGQSNIGGGLGLVLEGVYTLEHVCGIKKKIA